MPSLLILLQDRYQRLALWVNQLSGVGRGLWALTLLASIYYFWLALLTWQQNALQVGLQEEARLVLKARELRQHLSELRRTNSKLAYVRHLPAEQFTIVSRHTIIEIFQALLKDHDNFNLLQFVNLPDLEWPGGASDASVGAPAQGPDLPKLYRHGVQMNFISTYPVTYNYLTALEQLKWLLFWEEFSYRVTNYPHAEVKLAVYTVAPVKED